MSLINKLERNIGWIGIEHLPIYVVSAQALLYIWGMVNPEILSSLVLDPYAVQYGHEYWRLLTFLFIVPSQNPLFAFFFLYLLYVYGMALESEWGSFRFTLFYLIGALGTMISAFFFGSEAGAFYLNTSIFLAFAAIHADFVLYFFFVIPVKVKWLAWFTWAYFAYGFILSPAHARMAIMISLANYFLFFSQHHWDVVNGALRRYKNRQRLKEWK